MIAMIDIKEYFKKNRKYAICSVTAMAVLGASCFAGMNYRSIPVNDYQQEILAENEAEELTPEEKDALVDDITSKLSVTEKDIYKDETVYAFADASGKVDNIVVSEWLRNPDKKSELVDKTDLKDIENVKGDEAFSQSGDTITWQANGNDIYYQGTTNKELPVSVNVTYYLDGKETKASDMAGKSGKVTIRFDYTNNTSVDKEINGKKEAVSVPFVAISGLILDENATNIEVTNGKTMPQGGNTIVIGYAVPGLKDSLDMDDENLGDISLPEYFEVSADVTDFSLDMTMTAVVSASEFSTEGGIDTSELDDMVSQISEAGDALADGSAQLADGTATLLANMGDFETGANQLVTGANQLKTGADSLATGANQLAAGAGELKTGVDTLVSSSDSLATGVTAINQGAQAINQGVAALDAGLNNPMTEAEQQAIYNQASAAATDAVNKAFSDEKYDLIYNGAVSEFKNAVTNENTKQLIKTQVASEIQSSLAQNPKMAELSTALFNAYAAEAYSLYVKTAINAGSTVVATFDDYVTSIMDTNTKAGIQAQVSADLGEISSNLSSGIADLATDKITDGIAAQAPSIGENVASTCQTAAAQAAGQAAGQAAVSGAEGTKTQIAKQIEDGGLVSGAAQLAAGTSTLSEKIPSLTAGVDKLSNGADQIATGSNQLAAGTTQLATGSAQLADGSKKLADGSTQIADGVSQLNDGANELSDGMNEFNETAIKKIVEAYNGDVKDLAGRLEAVFEASSEYQTFTDINEGDAGITKFIIKTNGITE